MRSPLAAAATISLGEILVAPEALLADPRARFLKDHRRTAVASIRLEGRELFVKRFKPYAWYRRLEWLFAMTPAERCRRNSMALAGAGFRVPRLLAVHETRGWILPADSYFVTETVQDAEAGGRFWRSGAHDLGLARRRQLLQAAARELRRLHDAGFYSRDFNADNFLVRLPEGGGCEFFLLDLENIRRLRSVSRRRRVKNLVQLYRPVRGRIRCVDRIRFLSAYLGRDATDLRRWIGELSAFDEKKEKEYAARRRAQSTPSSRERRRGEP